jgi:hypothetical protein
MEIIRMSLMGSTTSLPRYSKKIDPYVHEQGESIGQTEGHEDVFK